MGATVVLASRTGITELLCCTMASTWLAPAAGLALWMLWHCLAPVAATLMGRQGPLSGLCAMRGLSPASPWPRMAAALWRDPRTACCQCGALGVALVAVTPGAALDLVVHMRMIMTMMTTVTWSVAPVTVTRMNR